jgi:hypothetical protein
VGQLLAFEIKEAFNGSNSFHLVDAGHYPRIALHLVTVEATAGVSTAAAKAYVYDDLDMPGRGMYIYSQAHFCGRDRVQQCARSTLASTDRAVELLRTEHRSLWNKLMGLPLPVQRPSPSLTPTPPIYRQ